MFSLFSKSFDLNYDWFNFISGIHDHQLTSNKNEQLRGEQRKDLAKDILLNHNGSCHKAREDAIANDQPFVPSQNTYNKVKSSFLHQNVPTSDWIRNLLFIGRSNQNCEMNYVQSCDIFPQFNMQLFLDQAIKILKSIPEEHRIGFLDSTGNLCRITKLQASWYNKIQNYFFLLKDLRNHGTEKFKSLLLSEMISSTHGTATIALMQRKVKEAYELAYGTKLVFRLISIDYCFAAIHANIETHNGENIITYANKVFHLGQMKNLEDVASFLKNRTWLVSCASHTMKRFVKTLKGKILKYLKYLNFHNSTTHTLFFSSPLYAFIDWLIYSNYITPKILSRFL